MLVAGTWAIKNPTQMEAIIPVAIAIVGAIGSFMPDSHKPKTEEPNQEEKPEEKEDDTRSGTISSEDSGRDAAGSRSRPASHPKADGRVEQKEESPVRQGNDFDIVEGGFKDSFGDK